MISRVSYLKLLWNYWVGSTLIIILYCSSVIFFLPPPSSHPFHYQAMWETYPDFPRVVNDAWKGSSMVVVVKLHEVQVEAHRFSSQEAS